MPSFTGCEKFVGWKGHQCSPCLNETPGTYSLPWITVTAERGRACQKAIRNNQLMGQDPRTGIKTKNQGQWQNMKEEYLWTLGNFEGFKNESGGEHTLEAFNLLSQVGSEVLCFRWAREKWEVKDSTSVIPPGISESIVGEELQQFYRPLQPDAQTS
ncbi:uncharacterized protein LOC116591218 isoform X2 [Mustela erminea]|uniref:uncharacterized protein LOC116591218 isoform X2 n=1 Tax=Mustela erminea TaxID=36723 RepID=UPI001386748F|nr:uncharacterized protein LOC116591218 isoform X2 [Mustela erminea]